jgi:hypothetical protein
MRTVHPAAVITRLAYVFPKAFFADVRRQRPLKINITSDIEALRHPELADVNIGQAVDYYVSRLCYQNALSVVGNVRIVAEIKEDMKQQRAGDYRTPKPSTVKVRTLDPFLNIMSLLATESQSHSMVPSNETPQRQAVLNSHCSIPNRSKIISPCRMISISWRSARSRM